MHFQHKVLNCEQQLGEAGSHSLDCSWGMLYVVHVDLGDQETGMVLEVVLGWCEPLCSPWRSKPVPCPACPVNSATAFFEEYQLPEAERWINCPGAPAKLKFTLMRLLSLYGGTVTSYCSQNNKKPLHFATVISKDLYYEPASPFVGCPLALFSLHIAIDF